MTKELSIQIVPKVLELTEDQKQKIENYNKVLEELPTLEVAVSLDGGKTFGGETLKLNIKDLISSDLEREQKLDEEEIVIDNEDIIEYILGKRLEYNMLNVNKEDIQKVLDLEFDFLKLKGVIE